MKLTIDQIRVQLKMWREETSKYSSALSVGYSREGIGDTLRAIERFSGHIDRLDEIRSILGSMRASIKIELYDSKVKLQDSVDKIRLRDIRKWIACGFNADERNVAAFSDVALLDIRIKIRSLEKALIYIDEVSRIIESKISSLTRIKYDCKVVTDILTLGISLGELKG